MKQESSTGSTSSEQFYPNAKVIALCDWLCAQGLHRQSLENLLKGFCERLGELGIPLMRGHISAQTLHPVVIVLGCSWRASKGIQTDIYHYQPEPNQAYLESPIKRLMESGADDLRVGLEGEKPTPFPICETLRADGGTDYFLQKVGFGRDGQADGETGVMLSWSTSEPGGFSDEAIALLRYLAPKFGIAAQTRISQDITINLLDTYVGRAAGKQILNGEIRRGVSEAISSVILLADLQGFTAMSERLSRDDLVDMLNQYFDCLVAPIVERGGNVLKFLGDGLLATFPLNGEPADHLCEKALAAASDILTKTAELDRQRAAKGHPVMELDLALHLGDVYWGNVGSAERLDFTVIGPAVNEAARIEALCAQYERCLLISETFAKAATRSSHRFVSIGRFALRGVRSAQSIYTLDEAGSASS